MIVFNINDSSIILKPTKLSYDMKFLALIPARYDSSRFPGKPLATLGGTTVIERVVRRAESVLGHGNVAVATDDERILRAVEAFGGRAVMTGSHHRSGTDRCFEAYCNLGSDADVVINIQGDEPFVAPAQIKALAECFLNPEVKIATLIKPVAADASPEELANPNRPKVVVDNNMDALYFSRSVIPFVRGAEMREFASRNRFFTHIGMYGFRAEVLAEVVALPQSSLELAESLEQLRWLQNGYRIRTAVTDIETIGIDTPADLEAAEKFLKTNPER